MAQNVEKLKSILDKTPNKCPFKSGFMYPPGRDQEAYATLSLMIHFRHHGIPSPLLDWSKDPYIAAFFALRDPNTCKDSAIFVLKQTEQNQLYTRNPTSPSIHFIDNTVFLKENLNKFSENELLLKRHAAQESVYSICYHYDNNLFDIIYTAMEHDQYTGTYTNGKSRYDYSLHKYIISSHEKKTALEDLYNTFSLSNGKIFCEFSYEDLAIKHLYFD